MARPIPDHRTIEEVEATRDMTNNKPYRSGALKAEAKRTAKKREDGTWHTHIGRRYHPSK
jgi:hypothetical protein